MTIQKIYHAAAMARNRVIGKDNKLPWHFPADLKNFKQLTMNQTLIMGRKTFDSIGRALPGRQSIVLTRKGNVRNEGEENEALWFADSIEEALRHARENDTERVFIIGGEEVFRQTLDLIDGVYLTVIGKEYEGDAFYPELPPYFAEKSRTVLQPDPAITMIFFENTKRTAKDLT